MDAQDLNQVGNVNEDLNNMGCNNNGGGNGGGGGGRKNFNRNFNANNQVSDVSVISTQNQFTHSKSICDLLQFSNNLFEIILF